MFRSSFTSNSNKNREWNQKNGSLDWQDDRNVTTMTKSRAFLTVKGGKQRFQKKKNDSKNYLQHIFS